MIIWSSINCPTVICLPTICYFSWEKPLVKPTAPRSSFSYICFVIYFSFAFLFRSIKPKKYKNTLLHFIFIYFIWRSIHQSTTIYLTSACLSWGAVPRKGLTTPLTCRVARCCCLCAGAAYVVLLGSPTGSIPWFHNWGKYLPTPCYIIPPSPGKYRRSFSYHQMLKR